MSVVARSEELICKALLWENPWRALTRGTTKQGVLAAATLWAGAIWALSRVAPEDERPNGHSCLEAALLKTQLASSNAILIWATAP